MTTYDAAYVALAEALDATLPYWRTQRLCPCGRPTCTIELPERPARALSTALICRDAQVRRSERRGHRAALKAVLFDLEVVFMLLSQNLSVVVQRASTAAVLAVIRRLP